jgi:hypothetical protein
MRITSAAGFQTRGFEAAFRMRMFLDNHGLQG